MSKLFDDDDYECPENCDDGWIENDCFEDTCCCADPFTSHGFRPCPYCNVEYKQKLARLASETKGE